MKGHSAKLKDEAIAALLEQPTVAAAARTIGISDQTLGRWMKNPEFDAACRAARQANHRQALARLSRRALGYVGSIRNIVADPKVRASTRLEAAQFVISEASHAREMEDFAAEVTMMERAAKASRAEAPKSPADEAGRSSRSSGHGAKFPRKKEEAIVHLLETPSVAKAAAACGIGVQTLYQWLKDPLFVTEFRAAECAVFGPASRLMQQGVSDAVTVIGNLAADHSTPAATRLHAAKYCYRRMKATEMADLEARMAAAESPGETAGKVETRPAATIIGANLLQRLERLKARLLPTNWFEDGFEFVHAQDGRPTVSSIIGSVWSNFPGEPAAGEVTE